MKMIRKEFDNLSQFELAGDIWSLRAKFTLPGAH